ncbi:MAG: hypothetical protein AABX29_06910 [Nanoarchaeota archaeon]
MIIKFIYNKIKDKKCWHRYNKFIKENKTVWGISRRIKQIITIKQVDFVMNVKGIINAYNKVFKISPPIIRGYIVTTPFSMINDNEKFKENESVIFYSIYTPNPSVVLAHEIFHIYFEKYTKRKIPNYNETKEYFTVIMNDIFGKEVSGGYPKHQKIREKILKVWQKTHSIDECIKIIKK